MPSQQQALVDKAQAINRFPVKRSTLIKNLGLVLIESERGISGSRGGRVSFHESWRVPSGLTVTAIDSVYVGNQPITMYSIDKITRRDPSDFVTPWAVRHPSPELPPRRSFDRITISSLTGKVVFDSADSKPQEDEHVVDGNPH